MTLFCAVGKEKASEQSELCSDVAGLAGFEPTDDGVKVRCLTAWRQPNIDGHGA